MGKSLYKRREPTRPLQTHAISFLWGPPKVRTILLHFGQSTKSEAAPEEHSDHHVHVTVSILLFISVVFHMWLINKGSIMIPWDGKCDN